MQTKFFSKRCSDLATFIKVDIYLDLWVFCRKSDSILHNVSIPVPRGVVPKIFLLVFDVLSVVLVVMRVINWVKTLPCQGNGCMTYWVTITLVGW